MKQTIAKNGNGASHADELDLVNLVQKAYLFFDRFKIILISSLLIGLATGLYFYLGSPKQYSTSLMVHSAVLPNQDEIAIIENWGDLLKREKSQLAVIMKCDVKILNKVSNISAEEILKIYSANNPNSILINVSVTDISILDELQNGIVYGLNNTPYVKEMIAAKRAKNVELIKTVNEEIAKLNSTKNLIDSMIRTKNSGSASLMVDISRINAEWIDLNERSLNYQQDLKFLSGVQVMQNFNKGKLVRTGLMKFSFLGIAAGCFIGYLVSLFLYMLQKIKSKGKPASPSEE